MDSGFEVTKLLVDGGMTSNKLLMQMQSDLTGIPVGELLATCLLYDPGSLLCETKLCSLGANLGHNMPK